MCYKLWHIYGTKMGIPQPTGAFGRLVGVIGALVMHMRECYSQHVVGAECLNDKSYTRGFSSVYTRRHLENSLHPSSDGEYSSRISCTT